MNKQTQTQARSSWSWWPISIISFFAVAIAGAVTFIVFCNLHGTDLVAADYYEQEVRYQKQMEQLNRTSQLGGSASVEYLASAKQLRVAIPSAHSLATGEIHLYRPSAADQDQRIPLAVDSQGHQLIDAARLSAGLWKIKVRWTVSGADFLIDQKVIIPALDK